MGLAAWRGSVVDHAVASTGSEGPGHFSLVIRRAGDWTDKLGRDVASGMRPTHLLVRRMRGYGFMHHAQSYERVLFVATGAGIGPVLPYLVERSSVDYECLWIGRNHRETIGDVLVSRIMQSGCVMLLDSATGRPDVGKCVAEIAERFDAVFIVSNQRVRDEVAIVCQRLNVPWYGPTFRFVRVQTPTPSRTAKYARRCGCLSARIGKVLFRAVEHRVRGVDTWPSKPERRDG